MKFILKLKKGVLKLFDTIRLKAEDIHIEEEKMIKIEDTKTTTYYIKDTGELNTQYQIKTEKLPYITYFSSSKRLIIQVSIPKFLFGENVSIIKPKDIIVFWDKLQKEIFQLLGVKISKVEWIVQRIDICWNFNVGNKVSDYIQYLGKKKLPYKQTHLINHSETVIFKNKSSCIMFYDKQRECEVRKQTVALTEKAFGILRMEIRPPLNAIRAYSSERKAVEILTLDFFKLNYEKVIKDISFEELNLQTTNISFEWLGQYKINRVETMLGFCIIKNSIGVSKTKEIYGSTYYARNKWIEEIGLPQTTALPSLLIEWLDFQENE